jgi:pilus assembly protein CpaF
MRFELILPFLRPIEALLLDENISEIMGNPDSSWASTLKAAKPS